jgi:hypothetical protein
VHGHDHHHYEPVLVVVVDANSDEVTHVVEEFLTVF